VTSPHPLYETRASTPEHHLTDEYLGGLLAAVGNHETKALIFSAMNPGTTYNTQGMYNLYLGMQGEGQVTPTNPSVPMQYCTFSYEPVGAVAKVYHGHRGIAYELTNEGERYGKAVAGHMLDYSARHPELSLKKALGLTLSNSPDLRSPLRRVEILEELASQPGNISLARLSKVVSQPPQEAIYQAKRLVSEGLLIVSDSPNRRGEVIYEAGESSKPYTDISRDLILAERVRDYVQLQIAQNGNIGRLTAVEHFLKDDRYQNAQRDSLVNRVTYVLNDMIKQGVLTRKRVDEKEYKLISIAPQARMAVEDLVTVIDGLRNPTDDYLAEGKRLAANILANKDMTSQLIKKARANSPQANGLPLALRRAKLVGYLRTNGAATAIELSAALGGEGITAVSARKTLANMLDSGLVSCVIQKAAEGQRNEKVWSLVNESDGTTSID
jgi:hypothetical protein